MKRTRASPSLDGVSRPPRRGARAELRGVALLSDFSVLPFDTWEVVPRFYFCVSMITCKLKHLYRCSLTICVVSSVTWLSAAFLRICDFDCLPLSHTFVGVPCVLIAILCWWCVCRDSSSSLLGFSLFVGFFLAFEKEIFNFIVNSVIAFSVFEGVEGRDT